MNIITTLLRCTLLNSSTLWVFLIMTIIFSSTLQARQFAGGSGTQANPYQISTASQLDSVRYFASAHFRQTADIDLNVSPYNSGSGWLPIPDFRGGYDGSGFIISNLFINRATTDSAGLFGTVNGASLEDISLSNLSVNARNKVGGLVGLMNSGTITRSYTMDGSVQGGSYVGGLAGEISGTTITASYSSRISITTKNGDGGGLIGKGTSVIIVKSYSINRVRGHVASGGLIGSIKGTSVTNSYAAGKVTGSGLIGGLVGAKVTHSSFSITNSYFNKDSTTTSNGFGTGLFDTEMQQQTSFVGWDFANTWIMNYKEEAFPALQVIIDVNSLFANGKGTQANPFQIATTNELNNVRLFSRAHFKQTADIDLNISPYSKGHGHGWNPIPNFRGSYDGGGFTISNLYISRAATDSIGLFARITDATLTNLTLSNPEVSGKNEVGALAGGVNSETTTMSQIRITGGTVTGNKRVGGLIGTNEGKISSSAATGMTISGIDGIGGLVGYGRGSGNTISNSYTINKIIGRNYCGGLIGGWVSTTITTSYAAGKATCSGNLIGGLGGSYTRGNISNSYFNSDSLASNNYGTALTTAQMSAFPEFGGFDFIGTWYFDPADPDGFPLLRKLTLTSAPAFSGGSGTKTNPYLLTTAVDVANISLLPGAHYKQTKDISLSVAPYDTVNKAPGWRPILDFTGSYDGGGFTISDLMINRPTSDSVGLFVKVAGDTLANLTLSKPSVTGKNVVGALAGAISLANTKVSKIRITGGLVKGDSTLGGLAGSNEGTISLSKATGMTIQGSGDIIGGLVGSAYGSGNTIGNSFAINRLSSSDMGVSPGGLVGTLNGGAITNSYTASSGGLGVVNDYENGAINNSYYNLDSLAATTNGMPLRDGQMRKQAFFIGLDFSSVWVIVDEGVTFPELRAFADFSLLFAGGSGTQADPYKVKTDTELNRVRLVPSAHFKQTADISLKAYQSGDGWLPIPDLTGSYDGGGYTISDLVIDRPTTDNVGLFAKVAADTLTNLTLSNPLVTGRHVVGALAGKISSSTSIVSKIQVRGGTVKGTSSLGGLVGSNEGKISLSAATGMTIEGSGAAIGGLVGEVKGTGSSVKNSYAINKMSSSGVSKPGALVGALSNGAVTNSYSASSGGKGLVNANNNGTITNSYFNVDSSAYNSNGGALRTGHMTQHVSFKGFDFRNTWHFDIANPDGFPLLRILTPIPTPTFSGGSGTKANPYLVATAADLAHISLLPGAYYKQTADIDLGVAPYDTTNRTPGWKSIPNFKGSYDGSGYTISNLTIYQPTSDTVGLFAKVSGASLTNLTLSEPFVHGRHNVGALVGLVHSDTTTMSQIRIIGGKVIGSERVGGLIGTNEGKVSLSAATGMTISGLSRVGGLVGYGEGSGNAISNSYAINRIAGRNYCGGLVGGWVSIKITTSYAAGKATCSSNIGGLGGSYTGGNISNSYFNSDSLASNGYGTAITTKQMSMFSEFVGFDFSGTWHFDLADLDGFPLLQILTPITTPTFSGGSGTKANPYLVATAADVANISLFPGAHYKQTADINLAPFDTTNKAPGWRPIHSFKGSYDGGGYTISRLAINRDSVDNVGLFGELKGGKISRLSITEAYVKGSENVGILVGSVSDTSSIARVYLNKITVIGSNRTGGLAGQLTSTSTLTESYTSKGSVRGSGSGMIGGLVGYVSNAAITSSYSSGIEIASRTTSGNNIGGLVGVISNASISNCYSNNRVIGNSSGGLFGYSYKGSVTNCYSASAVSGENAYGIVGIPDPNFPTTYSNAYFNRDSSAASAVGVGLSIDQMKQESSFNGFDFINTWIMYGEKDFPGLQAILGIDKFAKGKGTEDDPFQIAMANELNNVRLFPRAYFKQTADIDLGVDPYNSGEGWLPISDFTGSYDGGGFTISNLVIKRPASDTVGLFAKVTGGTLTNLILSNPSVTGQDYVGALVGFTGISKASISNIGIEGGSVSGTNFIGGMVGRGGGAVTQSYAKGMTVTGLVAVGGLIGIGNGINNSIAKSYAINKVEGVNSVGGLVAISNTITNSYSASKVTSTISGAEGLVSTSGGSITNSYYNSDSTAAGSGSGTALNTTKMRQQASFTGFDFSKIWFIDEDISFPGFQERKENELIISGKQGWRMLTSPLHSHSIGALFQDLWLQGFKGADMETGSPNLFFWDEVSKKWTAPTDTAFTPGGGKGFLMYVYGDDDSDGISEGFPKRLGFSGSGFSGNHTVNLTYTNSGSEDNDGWHLVGNPYPSSVYWRASKGWTRKHINFNIHIWDASANNGKGEYVTLSTLPNVGTKKDSKIAPWQSFWVKTSAPNSQITFSDAVKSAGGALLKQVKEPAPIIPRVTLELEGNGLSSKSIVLFHEQASPDKDSLDAYKLHSLNQEDYLLLGTSTDGKQVMEIQALPLMSSYEELELVIEGSDLNGQFTLNWTPEDLPEGWVAELIDTKTGEVFSLADTASYTFTLNEAKAGPKEKETSKEIGIPVSPITPVIKSKTAPARFVIRFGLVTSNETDPQLPQKVALRQNYPNPFNPVTTINYELPWHSHVRLEVFDILGRKVVTLVDGRVEAGYHQIRFDAGNLASGVYLYRLRIGRTILTKKLTLIK